MHEDVGAAVIGLYEPKALLTIEPFNNASFHMSLSGHKISRL
jgi:hypothetical protein